MTTLKIQHPDITDFPKTIFTAAGTAADATLTVENGLGFSANEQVVINGYGNATSEIRQISSSAPTATAIVLNASYKLQFNQGIGTTIQKTNYNQVKIEYSTDCATLFATGAYATPADAADDATWTALATTNIIPSEEETVYTDTSTASRAYRTRYYNSQAGTHSSYSDPILPTGFEENAVGSIIEKALNATGKSISKEEGGQLSQEFMLEQVSIALSEVDSKRKRWSHNQEFDYTLSEITAGTNDYRLPTNIDVNYTRRAMFNVRINNEKPLKYIDKTEYDKLMDEVNHSELAAELNTSSTTATFDDTSDFDDSGSFTLITGTTKDTVSYDSNNRTTNVLTLSSTTGVSTTHAIDIDVWQDDPTTNNIDYYTIYEGFLYLYGVPDTDLYQRTIKIDYYKKLAEVNSYQDYILFPAPNIVYYWLCYAIYRKLNDKENAILSKNEFDAAVAQLITNETTGQKRTWKLNLRPYQSPGVERVYSSSKYADEDAPDGT